MPTREISFARPSARGIVACLFVSALASLGGGCASQKPVSFEMPPEQYPAAFEAAKAALRDYRFDLERVDFDSGELSTSLKTSSGLATPWDSEQSTFGQDWRDYANFQARQVRIRFEPVSVARSPQPENPGTQAAPTGAALSPADAKEPILAQVEVSVHRYERPGRRPAVRAVQLSSQTEDPELTARGMYPQYTVVIERDELLAGRIAEAMQKQTKSAATASATPTPSPTAGQ
jgi:hypothetical protein